MIWGTVFPLGLRQEQGELWEPKGRRGPRNPALPGRPRDLVLPSSHRSVSRYCAHRPGAPGHPPAQHLTVAAFPRRVLSTASQPSCGNQVDSRQRRLTSMVYVRVPEERCHGYVPSGVSRFPPAERLFGRPRGTPVTDHGWAQGHVCPCAPGALPGPPPSPQGPSTLMGVGGG